MTGPSVGREKTQLISPRVTNDQFALVFEHTGGNVDSAEVYGLRPSGWFASR